MAATIREYLVSLGAEVDQKSFNKFKMALSGSMKTVTGFVGALAAVTTVLVKTSLSLDKTSQQYEAMAKKAKKTTEEIRAQETALKILGKSMNEVKADKKLKEQYDNLVKLGKQMALPGAGEGVTALRDMVKTVNEIRVVATYAMQWINYHMLNRIKAPLQELRKGLEKFKDTVKSNMPTWTKKVGDFLGNILRLASSAVKGFGSLLEMFNRIPKSIKNIGAVLASVFTISKMGGLGLLLTGLAALLLLLDDFYTYKRGGKSALEDLWKSFEAGENIDIVGLLTGGLDIGSAFVSKLFTDITNALNNFNWDQFGKAISTAFTKIVGVITNFISGGGFDMTGSVLTAVTALVNGIVTTVGSFIAETDWNALLKETVGSVTTFVEGIMDLLLGTKDENGKVETEGLIDSIIKTLDEKLVKPLGKAIGRIKFDDIGEDVGSFVTNLFTKIGSFFKAEEGQKLPIEELLGDGINVITETATGIVDFLLGAIQGVQFDKVGDSINTVLTKLFGMLSTGISKASGALFSKKGDGSGVASSAMDFVRRLISGIGAAFSKIQFKDIGSSIGSFVSNLFKNMGQFLQSEADKAAAGDSLLGAFGKTVSQLIQGLVSLIGNALGSIKIDDVAALATGLATAIGNSISDVAAKISSGEIDLAAIGTELGSAIGDGIVITTSFLWDFVASMYDWLANGGLDALGQIGAAIWAGLMNTTGGALEKIAGALGLDYKYEPITSEQLLEGYKEAKKMQETSKYVSQDPAIMEDRYKNGYKVDGYDLTGEEYRTFMNTGDIPNSAVERQEEKQKEFNNRSQEEKDLTSINKDIGYAFETMGYYDQQGASYLFENEQLRAYAETIKQYNEQGDSKGAEAFSKYFENAARDYLAKEKGYENYADLEKRANNANEQSSDSGEGTQQFDDSAQAAAGSAEQMGDAVQDAAGSADGLSESADAARQSMDSLKSTTDQLNQKMQNVNPGKNNAYGGRFDRATQGIFGEDGTEYIIPITKPNRAKELILRMFGEMGAGAASILEALGVPAGGMNFSSTGAPGTSAAMLPGMLPAGGGGSITSNSGNTVSAPTTINVYGSSDPVATGNAAANASASNIVRRVRGCFEG